MLGTANIKVRPLRLALLVEPNNKAQVRAAIRLSTSLWGGTFFPIIPLHKRTPKSWRDGPFKGPSSREFVQGCIEAFDPDAIVQFASTVPTYITDLGLSIVKPQNIWKARNGSTYPEPALGIGVADLLDDVYAECFKYKLKYPTKVVLPAISGRFSLFWASVFGEYPEEVSRAVETHYSEPLDLEQFQVTPSSISMLTEAQVLFPRRVTTWRLRWHRGIGLRNGHVFFMDASSVEDIVDYWNLRATGRSVIPLPKQFLEDESFKAMVEKFLADERRQWPHNSNHFEVASFVRSRNSAMDEMEAYARSLNLPKPRANEAQEPFYSLQHWYPRIWDEWARNKDGGVADIYGEEEGSIEIDRATDLELRLKPLLPKFAPKNRLTHDHGYCANEFDLHLYGAEEQLAEVYPKARGKHLASAISGIGFDRAWRIGRNGLVKLVRSARSEARKIPTSDAIFFAWLADHGWKAELSPPGILAKQIYHRLNGYSRMLADASVLGLIERMNGGSVTKDGVPQEKGRSSGERELSVAEVKERLKGPSGRSIRYEFFIEKGVFKLGLKTKCPHCQRNTWFAMSNLGESLECPKCLTSFPAAGNVDQAKGGWYYRTAGPFSVPNYADGAYTVLLTLDVLGDRASRRTTSIPSFVATAPGQRDMEADFAMFWRETWYGEDIEGVLFGECKTYGQFQAKDVNRMRDLARSFPGAVLVFSTCRSTLTETEIRALRRIAKSGRKLWKAERPINPVLILTGTELLTWERPPYCWSKGDQERFRNVYDLISLCNASQQLYLGLPSWHEDWQKRLERKLGKRKSRNQN